MSKPNQSASQAAPGTPNPFLNDALAQKKSGKSEALSEKPKSKDNPSSPSPCPQKSMYLFSNIFEKQDDMKNCPFVFEKHSLKKRVSDAEYGNVKIKSSLIRPRKQSMLHQQALKLTDINHDVNQISVSPKFDPKRVGNDDNANFKERYLMYLPESHKLIQFYSEDDSVERGVLQIKYARLKKTHIKDSKIKLFGFILMQKGLSLQFFSESEQTQKDWIEALKSSCILMDVKDEFDIGAELGRGNFAKVHECTRRNDPTQKKYALKTMEKKAIKNCKRNMQSVLQEIDIMRALDHPYAIKLYEVYESNKYIHLVLSYLDGGMLFDRISSKQTYQEKTAIQLMRNILEALNYLHERNIVHRDLKPENLLLASKDNDLDLRIADFGLASFIKEGEQLTLRCGTPGYVGPELLEDKGYDRKVDIFSVGVILYVLLSGRPAFLGFNVNEILIENKKCQVEFPEKYWSKISDKAKDLVLKMMQKDPQDRITAKEALQHEWFTQDEADINNKVIDFAKVQAENENQYQLDYQRINDPEQDVDKSFELVSCTPVMIPRKLGQAPPDLPPDTPWLKSGRLEAPQNATPVMKGAITIQKPSINNGTNQKQFVNNNGIFIRKIVQDAQEQKKNIKPSFGQLVIPQRKEGPKTGGASNFSSFKPGGAKGALSGGLAGGLGGGLGGLDRGTSSQQPFGGFRQLNQMIQAEKQAQEIAQVDQVSDKKKSSTEDDCAPGFGKPESSQNSKQELSFKKEEKSSKLRLPPNIDSFSKDNQVFGPNVNNIEEEKVQEAIEKNSESGCFGLALTLNQAQNSKESVIKIDQPQDHDNSKGHENEKQIEINQDDPENGLRRSTPKISDIANKNAKLKQIDNKKGNCFSSFGPNQLLLRKENNGDKKLNLIASNVSASFKQPSISDSEIKDNSPSDNSRNRYQSCGSQIDSNPKGKLVKQINNYPSFNIDSGNSQSHNERQVRILSSQGSSQQLVDSNDSDSLKASPAPLAQIIMDKPMLSVVESVRDGGEDDQSELNNLPQLSHNQSIPNSINNFTSKQSSKLLDLIKEKEVNPLNKQHIFYKVYLAQKFGVSTNLATLTQLTNSRLSAKNTNQKAQSEVNSNSLVSSRSGLSKLAQILYGGMHQVCITLKSYDQVKEQIRNQNQRNQMLCFDQFCVKPKAAIVQKLNGKGWIGENHMVVKVRFPKPWFAQTARLKGFQIQAIAVWSVLGAWKQQTQSWTSIMSKDLEFYEPLQIKMRANHGESPIKNQNAPFQMQNHANGILRQIDQRIQYRDGLLQHNEAKVSQQHQIRYNRIRSASNIDEDQQSDSDIGSEADLIDYNDSFEEMAPQIQWTPEKYGLGQELSNESPTKQVGLKNKLVLDKGTLLAGIRQMDMLAQQNELVQNNQFLNQQQPDAPQNAPAQQAISSKKRGGTGGISSHSVNQFQRKQKQNQQISIQRAARADPGPSIQGLGQPQRQGNCMRAPGPPLPPPADRQVHRDQVQGSYQPPEAPLAAPRQIIRQVINHADVGGQGGEFIAFERQYQSNRQYPGRGHWQNAGQNNQQQQVNGNQGVHQMPNEQRGFTGSADIPLAIFNGQGPPQSNYRPNQYGFGPN